LTVSREVQCIYINWLGVASVSTEGVPVREKIGYVLARALLQLPETRNSMPTKNIVDLMSTYTPIN